MLAAVLVGLFLAVGLVFPRFGFQSQVQIAAPIDEVYRVFAQSRQFGHQKLKARLMDEKGGTSFADGADTSQVEVSRSRTLVEWQVKQSLFSQIETERMSLLTSVAFLKAKNGTVVLVSNSGAGKNAFWRSLLWLYSSSMAGEQLEEIEQLRDLIEAR